MSLFRWMHDNGFTNNESRPTTHTLMSGGIISIPDEKYQDFLHLYAREVEKKNKTLTFSELRSKPVSKMYFDVDLLDEEKLGEGFALTLSQTIQGVIRSYYSDRNGFNGDENTFQCIVCTTPSKIVNKDGVDLTKNGFHIIFPFLNIDVEKAYQLRYNVVYEMERVMGDRKIPSNPWADAIDKAPYKGGLKMCGSFKMVNCARCKDSKKEQREEEKSLKKQIGDLRRKHFPRENGFNYQDVSTLDRNEFKDSLIYELNGKLLEVSAGRTCPMCKKGRHLDDRTYMPTLVLDSDGTRNTDLVESMSKNVDETMRYTSIRCQGDEVVTAGFKRPNGVPACPDETNRANVRNLDRTKLLKLGTTAMMEVLSDGVFKNDVEGVFTWKGPQIFDEDKIKAIETFIRGLSSGPYSKLQVKTVFEHMIAKKETGGRSSAGSNTIKSIIKSNNGDQRDDNPMSFEKSLLVRVSGDGSTYCANKGGEHTSNSIYFRFTPQFCYQKCFSRKEDIRSGGKSCGNYRSLGIDLPYSVGSVLFPDADIPVPPTSALAFSRINTPAKKNKTCASSHESVAKKTRITSVWGGRSLG